MNKRLAMIIGITIAVHMDVAGDPGAALKTKMSGKIKAPCKSLSPDQQKTELIVLMMPFQDLDSKKTDADYRFYVE
ncbi:MAG: hypothetical protein LBI95_03360, partial [Holosporales bacterium]|nr:hypothetical protein [Holosporales bacterium]